MEIITFKEIKDHEYHYLHELVYRKENPFILYQYGPYLVMHNDTSQYKLIANYDRTPIIKMMIDVSQIIKITNENKSIAYSKMQLMDLIKSLPKIRNEYAEVTNRIAWDILKMIKEKQHEGKMLESAMLDYSPIVPYIGTIVKPNMEHLHDRIKFENSIDTNILDEKICNLLKDNIISILLNCTSFLSVDNPDKSFMLKDIEIEDSISSDLLKIFHTNDNDVSIYFSLVYMRYCTDSSQFDNIMDYLIKLNLNYNKISKGEKVNVLEAMSVFEELSLPTDSSFPLKL